ncbi:MAG: energy transducer TonB [Pyrinomonadaceae bacterium]
MRAPLLLILLTLLVPASRQAQTGVAHFSKEGLSFDYPGGWALEDKGKPELQYLVLKRPETSALVMVVAQREPFQTVLQMFESREALTKPYVANVARLLGAEVPAAKDSQCITLGERVAVGFRVTGRVDGEQGTGEVYAVAMGQRLVHLVRIRADKDEASSAEGWKSVLDTLKVEPPAEPSPEAPLMEQAVVRGMLNAKALNKPNPVYPPQAMRAGATGPVSVHIVVDEEGSVISAHALSGHSMLRPAGEAAARRAKFSPTILCDKPVKVTGVVTYNFVLTR